jgi:hypothetical protein
MSWSLDIDSPLRGGAMPRSYSGDLRDQMIEVMEMAGASRGSVSPLEAHKESILALIAERPDLTLRRRL